jgi:hypothetical protein
MSLSVAKLGLCAGVRNQNDLPQQKLWVSKPSSIDGILSCFFFLDI